MANLKEFRLPDVGEGLTEAEIVSWKVRVGDAVAVNDILVEIETAKSLVELPSPYAGTVSSLLVDEGATVDVGTPIIAVDTAPTGAPGGDRSGVGAQADQTSDVAMRDDMIPAIPSPADDEAVEPGLIGGPAPGGRTSVLVGYGPRSTSAVRRPRKGSSGAPSTAPSVAAGPAASASVASPAPAAAPAPSAAPAFGVSLVPAPAPSAYAAPATAPIRTSVLAKPPVRKLAKTLGIDLATVTPTGPAGTVTRADVEAAAASPNGTAFAPAASPVAPAPDFDPATRERRTPIKGVRKAIADAMVASAFTAPHVTEFVSVDVTRSMKLLQRLREAPECEGVRIGPMVLVMKALLASVRRHPEVNASWDAAAGEIVVKDYVNLGIAAATPRGLIVPNIKDAGRLSLPDLGRALTQLTTTAREGRTQPQDMSGGTITITNVGMYGVDTGTPILNPGEAAILCVGAIRDLPWVHKGKVKPRKVVQLGLSFDHRIIDGELGSLFLSDIARLLEHPDTALLWA